MNATPDQQYIPENLSFLQAYTGQACAEYVGNQSVYILPQFTQQELEKKLMEAFRVIEFSK